MLTGCLVAPLLRLLFAGGIAIALLALIVYPLIYAQDATAAGVYRSAPDCESSPSKDCRSHVTAEVTNVGSFQGSAQFDVMINGKTVTITEDSGSYVPHQGDSVVLEMWRGQPVRVTGPEGAQMTTDQYPDARLKTDGDVLGIFLVAGFLALAITLATAWFGRGLLFAQFRGTSRHDFIAGIGLVLVLGVVGVPVVVVGQAQGWLPQGKAAGTVVAAVELLVLAPFAFLYRWAMHRRASRA